MTRAALRPVAAVVTDDLDAVRTVRYASPAGAGRAAATGLLVPLPGAGPSVDAALHE